MIPIKISDSIHYIGTNDRRKELFENIWPLPNGVSYNSFLINDDKTVLLDTVESGSLASFVGTVADILHGKQLDYLVINHMEPDHSGEIKTIVSRWPEVKIIGNNKTFKMLEGLYGITGNLHEVKDGDMLELGRHTLKFVTTPWVHWPETMMTYDLTDKVLFSGDAFGTFGTLDGNIFDDEIDFTLYEDEMRRYYSNIVGKYSNMVQKALGKLAGMEISCICPLHGPIWRSHPEKVIGLYDRWSRYEAEEGVVIVYASMYGNTAGVADYIARRVAEQGIRRVRVFDVSKTHMSYIVSEIWKYKGLILGSCAYNSYMFPLMENLCRELQHVGIGNRVLGLFGGYSWSGGGVKNLSLFATESGMELVGEPADIFGAPIPEKLEKCDALAKAVAERAKGSL